MVHKIKYFIITIFLFCFGSAQNFYSSAEVATAGAFLGGWKGTQAIHSNPALLGVKAGQITEIIAIDTFDISYRVRLASSKNEDDLIEMENRLVRDGFERDYIIEKQDSLFTLNASGFQDSFSAYNFSSNLPSLFSDYEILTDTTSKIIEKPKILYRVQVLATSLKDTLKSFQKNTKGQLKGFDTKVIFSDSLYKYFVGVMETEQDAIALKNSPMIQSISADAFVISDTAKISNKTVPRFSLTFPLRFAINMDNNLISADWINRFIGVDMVENSNLKIDLLSSIPSSGIGGSFGLNTGLLDLTIGSYGVSLVNLDIFSKVNIPKPITQIIFDGIRFNEPQNISNFDSRALIVNSTTFSYGTKVDIPRVSFPTYIGVGLRYLNGIFSYVDSYEGEIITKSDSVSIFSDISVAYIDPSKNKVASGFAFDLGIYTSINEKLSAQLSLIGLGGSLNSTETNIWRSSKDIRLSNQDITDISDYTDSQIDSINNTFSIIDETKTIEGKSVPIPSRLNVAASYVFSNSAHFKTSIQHLMNTDFIGQVDPRFSFGVELFPEKFYPVLLGISFGGIGGTTYGAGFCLKLKKFHINFSGNQSGGIGNSATGFSISSNMRLYFW